MVEEGVGLAPQGTRTKHEEEKEARVNEEEEEEKDSRYEKPFFPNFKLYI